MNCLDDACEGTGPVRCLPAPPARTAAAVKGAKQASASTSRMYDIYGESTIYSGSVVPSVRVAYYSFGKMVDMIHTVYQTTTTNPNTNPKPIGEALMLTLRQSDQI